MAISSVKESPKVVYFPGALTAQLHLVGGKGQSLIRMSQIGLPVPPGFVLTVSFFEPWISELKLSKEFKDFRKADELDLEKASNSLKECALKLEFTAQQKAEVEDALQSMEDSNLFAVRSSSPEEDLEGFSFAGGYETILGVKRDSLYESIKKAFTSCLDYRVQCYKLAHGFNLLEPRIAVVVQEQIASDISGVVFSINPLTNNYDEVVFNANWGLGESVVSGACTPDTVIVDKWKMQVKSRASGLKESKILLLEDGGTKTVSEGNDEELCLSDGVALSLTRYVKTLEDVFRKPVDIEWAVSKNREYILQARPVTSFIPLPEELITPPGKPKNLYLDASLVVQALEKPISKMGCSIISRLGQRAGKRLFGFNNYFGGEDSLARIAGGRIYLNLSRVLTMLPKESVASKLENMDLVVANTVKSLDPGLYANSLSPKVLAAPFSIVPNIAKTLPGVVNARAFPYKTHKKTQEALSKFKNEITSLEKTNLPINKLFDRYLDLTVDFIFKYSLPCFLGSRYALERMKSAARIIDAEVMKKLELALPHNVTTEMGLELYRLGKILKESGSKINIEKPIEGQELPEQFKVAWQKFLDDYGHRGPGELDIANPRYRDNPKSLLSQIQSLSEKDSDSKNPYSRFEEGVREREETYRLICDRLREIDKSKLNRFRNTYNAWETLGGYRELHKFCLIFMLDRFRQRLIADATKMVENGQLESVEQIFDLELTDIEKHGRWSKEDLSAKAKQNTEFTDRLKNVQRLPALIDSRGEILKPKMSKLEDGVVCGAAISSGVVRGKIKTLSTPDEKPLLPGEILVARSTDPGWTPLFVNAAGLILEVGGLLQHGALVAREYGLPCVGGITGATHLWEDGVEVELDGMNGTVKVID